MPEGHVIHSQARTLNRAFAGQDCLVDSPQGRFADGAALVAGQRVTKAEAYGKHLFIGFANERWIHIHLGLFGKWQMGTGEAPAEQGLIRLRMRTDGNFAELRGPTLCEVLTKAEVQAAIAKIGPDPIRKDAKPLVAWDRVSRSKVAIGALLMDQTLFAGVGNIYRAEVLFRSGMSPYRRGTELTRADFDELWTDLTVLMADGVKRRRIDTVRPEHMPRAMGREPRVDRHGGEVYVYRREGKACYVCGTPVSMAEMQARKLYWCQPCQGS